ncbi:hypothetical protein AKO1_007178 [Acrasis kona]|uniref:Uncharacterized protein n=1 Tax=Acrasis kona TaxID=1008807 RepID=A0AAW2YTU7_9EUKA
MSSNNQGTVLHPESDKRLKENQDGETYQSEAGRQSHKNTETDRSGERPSDYHAKQPFDEAINDDNMKVISHHENARGGETIVMQNEETGLKKTYPNVNVDGHEGLGEKLEQAE